MAAPAGSVTTPPIMPFVCTSCAKTPAAARLRQRAINKDQSFLIWVFSLSEPALLDCLHVVGPHTRHGLIFTGVLQTGETGGGNMKNNVTDVLHVYRKQ